MLERRVLDRATIKQQGLNFRNLQGISDILMDGIADSNTYQKRVHIIHHFKGFGKNHVEFPLFVPQKISSVYLCMFRYVENDRQTNGYCEAKAYGC